MDFNPKELRRVLGSFVTGVTIVTAMTRDGDPRGFTANSFTSVSLDPPLVLVCLANSANSFDVFSGCSGFNIHILADSQRDLSNRFASRHVDKFADVEWHKSANGAPEFSQALAVLNCEAHERVDAGDHMILIGRVVACNAEDHLPLTFFRGGYTTPGLVRHDVDRVDGLPTTLGCLAHWQDKVLLCRQKGASQWSLPMSNTLQSGRGGSKREDLLQVLHEMSANINLLPPYSIFESADKQSVYVIFRGVFDAAPEVLEQTDTHEFRLFSETEIPWEALNANLYHTMLRRFFREVCTQRYGLYSNFGQQA